MFTQTEIGFFWVSFTSKNMPPHFFDIVHNFFEVTSLGLLLKRVSMFNNWTKRQTYFLPTPLSELERL